MIRVSKQVKAGKVLIGGDAPVSIQSMLSRPAADVEGNIRQALDLEKAGCEIVRVAIPDMDAVRLVDAIKSQIQIPLVADIPFRLPAGIGMCGGGNRQSTDQSGQHWG